MISFKIMNITQWNDKKHFIFLSGMKYLVMKKNWSVINTVLLLLAIIACLSTLHCPGFREKRKKEIFQTEKEFEKMASDQSIAAAFYAFADENAVINRGNDSLIHGREGIRNYYANAKLQNAIVHWTPDFVDVSKDGILGYTFGKYEWKVIKGEGDTLVSRGVFHTVWKKQKDGSWKYVWD
jgi:ketosteroid isomerase-like protein